MRVIAGRLRGRRLRSPTWAGLRPTSDRLRETLFDVLGARVRAARLLDGFAGTGAVGIEALSRGAAAVVFVERDPRAIRLIRENLRHCGLGEGYAIVRAAFDVAVRTAALEGFFDLIVLDPPYDEGDLEGIVGVAATRLAAGGLLVLEHARRRSPPGRADGLECRRSLVAGDSALSLYVHGAAGAAERAHQS